MYNLLIIDKIDLEIINYVKDTYMIFIDEDLIIDKENINFKYYRISKNINHEKVKNNYLDFIKKYDNFYYPIINNMESCEGIENIKEKLNIKKNFNLVSYCNNTWPSIGGVARYDTQLSLVFPDRIFFKGPQEKDKMLEYLKTCEKPIVITDNHLACDIPNEYPCLLVHHGCALTTAERNPEWDPYWRDLCCNGQKQMLSYRNPKNTWIISTSKSCTYDFTRFYPELYPKFKRIDLIHSSELNEEFYKKSFNEKPVILGNWNHPKKGKHLIPKLKELLPEFKFVQLKVMPENGESLETFNKRKQNIYLNADLYLMISNSEAGPYTSIDGMGMGLINVSTNIGIFEFDVDSNAYVELDWEKCYGENIDYEYICNKIRYAWKNKEEFSKKGREWYMKNCRFDDWATKMKNIINEFYQYNYN